MDAGWWYAIALAVVLALGAAALGMAQQKYKDHPRTPHLLGIGMAVCIFAAVAIIGMVVLGALGMGVVRSITIPAGAAVLAFGLFWPQIERYAGYRPNEAPTPVPTAVSSVSAPVPEQGALSVTSAMGREKRPDRAYFAARLETGNMWLADATNPEPIGGPPTHTLADQAYGTWTVFNDAARAAINVHLSFAYQWQRMGHTEPLSLGRTVGITIPRIDGKSRVLIRIVNFTSEYVLLISPEANCAFEAPGDTSRRPCILQGANPARRENILTLFPGAQGAREPSAIMESAPAPVAHRRPIVPPPRPTLGKLTVLVTDEHGAALDEATVSGYSEDNGAPIPASVTGEDGVATFEAVKGRKYRVLVAHGAFPGDVKRDVDGGDGLLPVTLKGGEENVASLIITGGTGTLPGHPDNRIGPKEGSPQNYVYVNGLSVGAIPASPAYFDLNKWFTAENANHPIVDLRFRALKGEVALLDYRWPSPAAPPKPDDTLRTLREVRTHGRADIRRRTEEIVSRISILTGEFHDASFRAEQVAPDLDGALRDEAGRIRRLFVDDLLDPVQKLAAEYARLKVNDEGLDAILSRTSFIRRIPTIDDIREIEKRLALLPDKLDALE